MNDRPQPPCPSDCDAQCPTGTCTLADAGDERRLTTREDVARERRRSWYEAHREPAGTVRVTAAGRVQWRGGR